MVLKTIPGSIDRIGLAMTRNGNQDLNNSRVRNSRLKKPSVWCPYGETEASDVTTIRYDVEPFPGQAQNQAFAYRHGKGNNAMGTMLFGDIHVEQRSKYNTPGYWSMVKEYAYYGSFYNPWPMGQTKYYQ